MGIRLTTPHFEHVKNEKVVESNLRLGNRAGGAVELRHHHGISQLLLVVSLQRESATFLSNKHPNKIFSYHFNEDT